MVDSPSFAEFALDPDEQTLFDLLTRLVGEGPASFFRDACRLVKQEPGLRSATHLASHLCREVDSAIEQLLVDPKAVASGEEKKCDSCGALLTEDRCEACGSSRRTSHKQKRKSVLTRWGVPEGDPLAAAWLAEDELAKHAHRRGYGPPRIVDADFLEHFNARTRILWWLLEHFEDEFLRKLKPLVDSALAKGPLGGGVADLKALPFTLVAHGYLFKRLGSGDWIEPLVMAGFYSWPPAASVDGEGGYFPSWPQSDFLARHARERPDEVCAAVLAIPDSENPLVIQDIFEIAEALPASLTLKLIPKLRDCLAHYLSMPWRLALPVIRALRDAAHSDQARELALVALARGIDQSGMARDERQEAIELLSPYGDAGALPDPGLLPDATGDRLGELRRLQWMQEHTTGYFVTPQSPLTKEEINKMCLEELAEYAVGWRPSGESLDSPTERGLAESVCRLVDQDPVDMARHAPLFADAPAEFAGWFLSAFIDALKKGVALPWESLLDYVEAVSARANDRDEYHWARQEVAALLEEALRHDGSGLEPSHMPRVWLLIAQLAADRSPTPEDEASYMNDDPFTYSLNCVAGRAVHTLFAYLSRVRRAFGDERFRIDEHAPEIAGEIERLLASATSLAVRAALGAFWPSLFGIDSAWATQHAGDAFPLEADNPDLWRTAWVACVCWNRPNTAFYRAHLAQYLRAAQELPEVNPHLVTANYHRRFAEHLGLLMLWCAVDPRTQDEVLTAFLASAPVAARNHLVDFLGRCLCDTRAIPIGDVGGITLEARDKLVHLAKQRVARAAGAPADAALELEGIGLWLVSGLLDEEWSLKCFGAVAKLGGKTERPDLVGRRLADTFERHPRLVLEACDALLDGESAAVVFRGRRPEISAILEAAEGHEDTSIAEHGRQLRSRLVARGFIAYGTDTPPGQDA